MEAGMITIHERDSLRLEVPVSFDAGGSILSLAGASVSASALKRGSAAPVLAATASVSGDTIIASWAAASFTRGTWRVQVLAQIGGQTQTVAESELRVMPSNSP
jgi:hypothetical protein